MRNTKNLEGKSFKTLQSFMNKEAFSLTSTGTSQSAQTIKNYSSSTSQEHRQTQLELSELQPNKAFSATAIVELTNEY